MKWNEIQEKYMVSVTVETQWYVEFQGEDSHPNYEREDNYWNWKVVYLVNKNTGELTVVDVSDLITEDAVISAVEERVSKI